jgi:hypothetical protein
MFELFIIAFVIVALSVLLLGINILVFGRRFPETEVGKNRHMIRLGLRCPQCDEKKQYARPKPVKIDLKNLHPDWPIIKG